jgi:hypothetical protein
MTETVTPEADFTTTERKTEAALAAVPCSPIPERHLAFCRAVARLAREHGLNGLGVTFTPPFQDEWNDQISFRWEQGRHGESSGRIFIESTARVHTQISENDTAQAPPRDGDSQKH